MKKAELTKNTTTETQYAIFGKVSSGDWVRVHTFNNATKDIAEKIAQDQKWLLEHRGVTNAKIMKRTVVTITEEWEEA